MLSAVLAMTAFTAIHAGDVSGRWNYYPALDIDSHIYHATGRVNSTTNVGYMAEGQKYVYMLITGRTAKKDLDSFKDFRYIPARFEKNNPDAKVEPLVNFFELSGREAVAMECSPGGGYVAIAYTNGKIDIIHDDGRHVKNGDLATSNAPGAATPFTISLDDTGNYVFVTTAGGFLKINAQTGEADIKYLTGRKMDFATQTGTRIFAGDSEKIYCFESTPDILDEGLSLIHI